MPDFIYQFTSLPRPLDPAYPTNTAISIIMMLVTLAAIPFYALNGSPFSSSLILAAFAGLSVFIIWALAREMDPDHPSAAFVAVGLAIPGMIVYGLPDFLVLFFLLVGTRILNRTVGKPATLLDSTLFLILCCVFALRAEWIYPLFAVNIYLLDSRLAQPNPRQIRFAMGAVAVMGIAFYLGGWQGPTGSLTVFALLAMSLVILFVTLMILQTQGITSTADLTGEPLNFIRVLSTQMMVLLVCVFIAVWHGTLGLIALYPVWGALLGIAAFQTIQYNRTPQPTAETEAASQEIQEPQHELSSD